MEHVFTDATKIGWGHVVIVCNNYFALFIYHTTHRDNYHIDRTTPFDFIQLNCYIISSSIWFYSAFLPWRSTVWNTLTGNGISSDINPQKSSNILQISFELMTVSYMFQYFLFNVCKKKLQLSVSHLSSTRSYIANKKDFISNAGKAFSLLKWVSEPIFLFDIYRILVASITDYA